MLTPSEEQLLREVRDKVQSALSAPIAEVGALLGYAKNMLDIILYEGRETNA
jgi:hypothetical protein